MRFISSPIPNESGIIGQIDASVIPRFTEPNTFARLPQGDHVDHVDIAIIGVPFDAGVSYRPGTRFGPSYIHQCSKLIRPYNPALDLHPFAQVQVADFGDIAVNPFNIPEAISMIERAVLKIIDNGTKLLTLGGDHTIALPLLRAFYAVYRKRITVVHFDAHLDTWDTYFGAAFTHGTPFRRASEEGLIDMERSVHVGIRGSLYSKKDLEDDQILGFRVSCWA